MTISVETPEHRALDEAIRTYVAARDPDGKYFPTGWVLCVVAAHTEDVQLSSYFAPFQTGMPYHGRIGLLQTTKDDMVHASYEPASDDE